MGSGVARHTASILGDKITPLIHQRDTSLGFIDSFVFNIRNTSVFAGTCTHITHTPTSPLPAHAHTHIEDQVQIPSLACKILCANSTRPIERR